MSTEPVVGTGEAARQLGLQRWQLAYLLERELVPQPSLCVPGRRLFTKGDIIKIREIVVADCK